MRSLIAGALCAMVAGAAAAETRSLETCRAISNSDERLRCYDAMSPTGSPPAAAPAAVASSAWTIDQERSRLDDSVSVYATLTTPELGGRRTMHLMLRCHEGRTDMMVQTGSFLGAGGLRGAYRIDDRPAVSTRFISAADGRAAFFPQPVVGTVRGFPEAGRLYVRVFSFNGEISEGTFRLDGVDEARRQVGEACRWPTAGRNDRATSRR